MRGREKKNLADRHEQKRIREKWFYKNAREWQSLRWKGGGFIHPHDRNWLWDRWDPSVRLKQRR